MSTTYDVINPATGKAFKQIKEASVEETDAIIAKAAEAFKTWRNITPYDRSNLLRAFSNKVREHREELAKIEIENSGHTRGNALWEADNVANVLNYYAGVPERLYGRQIPVAGGVDITFKEPIGVVGIIVPWNFPMPIAGWGFSAALATGNTVVLKPAELTPLTAIRLGELALEAGIPEGVLNIIPGKGSVVGNRFVTNPLVRKVSFTGSTVVGKSIMAGCADQVKRVTLELGGKSANIIFADTDIEAAANAAPGGVFDNAGQDCCARTRILVEKKTFDKFMEHFEKAVKSFRCEDPNLDSAGMGPLISKKQMDVVTSYIDDSVAFQGTANPSGDGFWVPPTVLLPKDTKAKAWQEEIFGPVVAVLPFEDEADAIAKANDSIYGLSGSIYTSNLGKALRVSRAVETGNLSVNSHSSVRYWTPFGGFKQSGLGRALGPDSLDMYTETKNVFFNSEN